MENQSKNKQIQIQSIKNENESLRDQLKELNTLLTKELDRKKGKKMLPINEKDHSEKMKKFLDQIILNNEQQIKYYKTQMKSIKSQDDKMAPGEKIEKLVQEIKDIDKEISNVNNKLKELEFNNKNLEKEEFEVKNSTNFTKNINIMTSEINILKRKIEQINLKLSINDKNEKKQKEHINKIEQKYQDLATKLNIPSDLSLIKTQIESSNTKNLENLHEYNEQIKTLQKDSSSKLFVDEFVRLKSEPSQKKKRYGSVKEYKDEEMEDFENRKLNENNFNLLRGKIEKLANIILKETKNNENKKNLLGEQIVNSEFENHQLENKIKEKEKEITLANSQYIEIKKTTKSTIMLSPLTPQIAGKKQLEEFTNKSLIIKNSDSRKRKTKRVSDGSLLSYDVIFFDDSEVFGDSTTHILKEITFFLTSKNIVGFQGSYLKENELILGHKNIIFTNNEMNSKKFIIDDHDYIRNCGGFVDEGIEFLWFETEKGKKFEVGNNIKGEKTEFSLNIRNFDRPITLFGALDMKKKGKDYVLAVFGVEVVNDLLRKSAKSKEKKGETQTLRDEGIKSAMITGALMSKTSEINEKKHIK